jgi:hypothetical protein
MAGSILAAKFAGPIGSAWYSAYVTQLNGGSIGQMAKNGAIAFGTSGAMQAIGGSD